MNDSVKSRGPKPDERLTPVVIRRLTPAPDPELCFRKLASRPGCIFFDSALRHPTLGRYSFLAADPFDVVEFSSARNNLFPELQRRIEEYRQPAFPELPPFQGGLAGCLSFDLNRSLESIAAPRFDEFELPVVTLGMYDVVIAWDHELNEAWLISQGFPETDPNLRRRRAERRADKFLGWLSEPPLPQSPFRPTADRLPLANLAPQSKAGGLTGLLSNLSADEYLAAIRQTVDYIWAGDIFQVNLAQRLLFPKV